MYYVVVYFVFYYVHVVVSWLCKPHSFTNMLVTSIAWHMASVM